MTPLPQRKKTAEEVAQLRDQLGIPPSVDSAPALEVTEETQSAPTTAPSEATQPLPAERLEPEPRAGSRHRDPSGIPARRHSPEELEEMQRRDMLTQLNPPPLTNYKFIGAHPIIIILGYLLAAAAAASFWVKDYPLYAIAGSSAAALLLAGFLAMRRPVSRHHAGFISVITVLIGVFATIHQLPQLQHAS